MLVVGLCDKTGLIKKMVSRLLEEEKAVWQVLRKNMKTSHLIPTWQNVHVWKSIANAVSPIADLTDLLSGDSHVTILSFQPVLHNLRHKVLTEKDSDTTLDKNIKVCFKISKKEGTQTQNWRNSLTMLPS